MGTDKEADSAREVEEALRALRSRERGGPRSKLVDAIFVLLLSRPMKAAEIAQVVNKEPKYVSSYLSYWRSRGYVDYDMGLWYLTPKGEEYARQIVERAGDERFNEFVLIAQRLLSDVGRTRNDRKASPRPGEVGGYQRFIAAATGQADNEQQGDRVAKAACVLQALKDRVTDEEAEIIMEFLKHYSKFGVTYMYLDQLAEALKADYEWLLRRLRSLQSKGMVYIYTDPRLGIRTGLSRSVKELLTKGCAPNY